MTPIFLGNGSLRGFLLVGVCVWAIAAAPQSRRPAKTRTARTVPDTGTGTATWSDSNKTHVWSDSGNWNTSPTSGVVPGVGSGVDYDVTVNNVNPPNNCMDDVPVQLNNLTIGSGIGVFVQDGESMTLDGSSLSGNLVLQSTKSTSAFVKLEITGVLTYTSPAYPAPGLQMFGDTEILGNGTLINQGTISYGVGFTAGQGLIENATLQNNGLIYADQNSPLHLFAAANWTNTGTIQAGAPGKASGGSNVFISDGTITQTGAGQLLASPGDVTLAGCTISGGQLAAAGGGGFHVNTSRGLFPSLANLTIATGTPYTIGDAQSTDLVGTITNNGTINVTTLNPTDPVSTLYMNGAVTLSGQGLVVLAGPNTQITGASLINQGSHTIGGVGEIKVGQVTNQGMIAAGPGAQGDDTLVIIPGSSGFTNNGTLTALTGTSILEISGRTLNNAIGTISAGSGTVIFENGVKIQGGTLSGGGPFAGTMEGKSVTLDGSANPIILLGTFTVNSGDKTKLNGTINDDGGIFMVGSPSDAQISVPGHATLNGTGSLFLGNGSTQNLISGNGSTTSKLIVNIPSIGGSGTIDNINLIIGKPSTLSTGPDAAPLILGPGSATQVNGTITVPVSRTITGQGTLNNCVGGSTLSGGTWKIAGTLQANCEVNTNSASITLTYPGTMLDLSGKNMFTNFTSNSSTGKFTVAGGQFFQTPAITDAGTVNVQLGNTWSIAGGGNYSKTAGTVTNDGTIEAGTYNATGGTTGGTGTWQGNVVIGNTSGTVTATLIEGDTPTSPGSPSVTGSFTLQPLGTITVPVIVSQGSMECGNLNVTDLINFQGTLKISLAPNNVPAVGQSCTIANSPLGITTNFAKIEGQKITSTEHFTVTSSSNGVTLAVVQ